VFGAILDWCERELHADYRSIQLPLSPQRCHPPTDRAQQSSQVTQPHPDRPAPPV